MRILKLNEIEMITAKLWNVRTNIILEVHQMNKVSHIIDIYYFYGLPSNIALFELGGWSE